MVALPPYILQPGLGPAFGLNSEMMKSRYIPLACRAYVKAHRGDTVSPRWEGPGTRGLRLAMVSNLQFPQFNSPKILGSSFSFLTVLCVERPPDLLASCTLHSLHYMCNLKKTLTFHCFNLCLHDTPFRVNSMKRNGKKIKEKQDLPLRPKPFIYFSVDRIHD